MKHTALLFFPIWFLLIFALIFNTNKANASHSEGADITYKCLGGNQYELTASFYRDCAGINAPTAAIINCSSVSTGQNFNITLQPIPGTGQEITLICSNYLTECQGGTYPGVQEWIYRGVVTITPAADWIFSFDLCCRNAAITTIVNPGGQNIHVESTLDNLNFPCNSSPVFTTKPIPFVCLYQNYTFNHGAGDPDGDFITYELVTPMNGFNSTITYIVPYTATQPLSTNPMMQFDTVTGDLNMKPTMLEVTVFAVKVKSWRNNQLTGTVTRDIQMRTMNCTNSYPYINGINGTGAYMTTACAGSPISFNIYTYDPDTTQVLTLTWNAAIAGASFTVGAGNNPTGVFTWTPAPNQTGTFCFTITVTDNNCPINGSLTYAICLVVYGVNVNVTATTANCGASNGTLQAAVSGGQPPYNFLWQPCGCQNNPLNGQPAGLYTVTVTDNRGCTATDTGTVAMGAAPGNVSMSSTPVSCFGASDGTATANANGGQPPYSYLWSNGQTTATITGLPPGNYVVIVTTAQGCVKYDSILILQPSQLNALVSQTDALCFGQSSGTASVVPSGGNQPYSYLWNTGQTTSSVAGLSAGNYFVTVTDASGCTTIQNVFIGQPAQLSVIPFSMTQTTCFGGSNGALSVSAIGGVAPYIYLWSNGQSTSSASALVAGNYSVNVTDANGCVQTASFTITQPLQITSSINSSGATCFGSNTGSASVIPAGGSPSYSYLWSNGQTISSVSSLSAGTYTVIITDANGCTHTNTVAIAQPALLSSSVTNTQNVSCNGGSNGSSSISGSGGTAPYSYLWSTGQTSSSASPLASGTYSVTLTDANGCTAVNSVSITQPNGILVSTSPSDTICPGAISIISASASGGTSPFTYFWQPNVGFGSAQAVNPNTTTTYTAIITDANGCTMTGSVTVIVYGNNMSVSLQGTPAICVGQNATLTASVSGSNITSYTWSHNLGNGTGPYVVSPTANTTYSVTLTNICGATVIAWTTVIVNPLPQISLQPQTAVGCDYVTLQFTDNNPSNVGSSYLWNFGDGYTSVQANPSHIYSQTGTYTVTVTVTSQNGCSSSAQTVCSAIVTPSPVANFTSDPPLSTSIINPDFRFFDQSVNATQWSWDFGDGNTSTLQNPQHRYAQTGIYTVKLITVNAGMCIDSIIKTVEVDPEFTFYIPNTFTPNGDHTNDVFTGKGNEIIEFEMLIFDRWGNEIFKTNDLILGWDGRANGGVDIAQEDVYVYTVSLKDFSGKPHIYRGHVNLVK